MIKSQTGVSLIAFLEKRRAKKVGKLVGFFYLPQIATDLKLLTLLAIKQFCHPCHPCHPELVEGLSKDCRRAQ